MGCFLILFAGCGLAVSVRRELDGHLALLYELRQFFAEIEQLERGSLLPMEHILREAGKKKVLQPLCMQMAAQLEEKGTANGAAVWQAVFLAEGKKLGLTEEERHLAAEAGSAFFGRTVEENRKKLGIYLERIDFRIETVRGEQEQKRKVYQTICVLGSMMLVILFI
jgi:stage III sporulation protein AB